MFQVYEISTRRRLCVTGSARIAHEFADLLRERGRPAMLVHPLSRAY